MISARCAGCWPSSTSPLVVLGLSDAISGLGSALLVVGVLSLAAALAVRSVQPVAAH